jgi:hypothetical protein
MVGCAMLTPIKAFDWGALTAQDTVVDIGGNLGTVTQTLARQFSNPQFVIQDKAKVIPGAQGVG